MPSDSMITLIIDAKNLASAQLKGLQKDLKGVDDAGARTNAMMQRGGMIAKGALSLGLGLAAKGASEMSDVQARLQSETGASADEAHKMAQAVNEIAGSSRQTMSAVSDAMAKVHTDLGLTGAAADKATRSFVDFARVTSQDAGSAVTSFDDILDAWNLNAADSTRIMDELVVSHQKFGGTVAESESALSAMAPAMQAANMSVDDGIALLNLFNASGVDATKATTALNKAVKGLAPGQSLNDLIAQIGAIEDPTARAQKAIAIFGAKAGVGMAQAIKPGMTSLSDFGIAAGEAAGATDKAAKAIDSSFPAMIQKAMSEAAASVRGFGDTFGPTLMVAMTAASTWSTISSALGVSLSGALKGAWAAAAGSPMVQEAMEAAGGNAGLAFAKGFVTKALPMIGIALAGKDTLGEGSPEGQALKAKVQALVAGSAQGAQDAAPTVQAAVNAVGEAAGRDMGQGWTSGIAATAPEAAAATGRTMEAVKAAMASGYANSRAAGAAMIQGMRDAIIAGKSSVVSAWTTALSERNRAADIADQILVNNAQIAAAKKTANDKHKTEAERAAARITLRDLKAQNTALLAEQAGYGTRAEQIAKTKALLTSKALLDGLKSKDPDVRHHWEDVKKAAEDQLKKLSSDGTTYGQKFTSNFSAGLVKDIDSVGANARAISRVVKKYLQVNSPSELGAFSEQGGPEGWGARFGTLYAKGLSAGLSGAGSASASFASSAVGGAAVSRPALAGAAAAGAGAGGGVHLHVHSAYPPTRAQISEWADQLDAEFSRRRNTVSPWTRG